MNTMKLFNEITKTITHKANRMIQSIKIEEAAKGAIEEFSLNIRILHTSKNGQYEGGVNTSISGDMQNV